MRKQEIPTEPRPLPDGPLYFVGVGGAGMSAIAYVLAQRGREISGSDPGISPAVQERLESVGVTVYRQHDPTQLGDVAAVIATDAVNEQNVEIIGARERGVPVFRRPEALAAIFNAGRGIAIAGTHGKTTTTGMVASILLHAGLEPTILIGGDLPLIGGNARNGDPTKPGGDIVLAESCEAYDGFLYLHPEVAVITNIEADHLDYHGTEEAVFASFARFVGQVRPNGTVVWCGEDENTAKIVARLVSPEVCSIRYTAKDDLAGSVHLKVPGVHNVRNAMAAAHVAEAFGIAREHIIAGLEAFTGTGRRFERLGEVDGVLVVDDYAHHPTEIKATLAAARAAFPDRRLIAVFQPHLPSRTRDFMDDFAAALAGPEDNQGAGFEVFLTDIYLAREQPLPGVSSETLAEKIRERRPWLTVQYVPDKKDLPERLNETVRKGDIVLTMGAGDIRKAGEGLLAFLRENEDSVRAGGDR